MMMKPTLALLFVPAVSLANPTQPPRQLKFQLTVKHVSATRTHQLLLLDRSCGSVREKSGSHEDEIEVCTDDVHGETRLRVAWSVRQGTAEYKTKWESLVARKGGLIEAGRLGGTRLAIQMQEVTR